MAKRAPKKRMNRKMKRTIRKSLSALFMATAIAIAAIPVQDNTAAETTIPVYVDGVGSSQSAEEAEIPYSVTDADVDSSLGFSCTSSYDGYVITETNGEYFLDLIYKIGTNGSINAITGYNIDYEPSGGTLTIPLFIAKSYEQFQDTDVKAAYMNGSDYSTLQLQYNNYNPGNEDGYEDDGITPKYKIDFSKMTEAQVLPYARDVYACDRANYTPGYKAQIVHIGRNDVDGVDQTAYVPYNTSTSEFYITEQYEIGAIADGAFASNKGLFSKKDPTATTDSAALKISKIVLNDRLTIIGDEAFKGMANLESVDLQGVTTVGNRTFEGCNGLQSVNFANVSKIGTEAFKDCTSLNSVTLEKSLKKIYPGAFANCASLSSIDMSKVTGENIIDKFAFYNCTGLNSIAFSNLTTSIGDCAFAVSSDKTVTGSLTSIEFPIDVNTFGKAVVSGRSNLLNCTLPKTYGGTSPTTLDAGFFRQCKNLQWVKINGPYLSFADNTFVSVTSDEFYIEGPATYDGSDNANYDNADYYSNPRVSAHEAGITYKFTANGVSYFDVAYSYQKKNADGELLWQDAYGNTYTEADGIYDASGNLLAGLSEVTVTDYYLINANTGALEKYTPDADNNEYTEIVIKGNYNGVSVKSVDEGCFDSVKNSATKLTVEDNTISEIGASAFEGFTALKVVDLGNSITKIGNRAFANCDSLTDVYFNMDNVTIGSEAFTKSSGMTTGLTFYGKIASDFEPFVWAMQKDNNLSEEGLRVLYKSLEPESLAAIYDVGASTDDNSVVTLMYYPIYQCLDDDNEDYRREKASLLGIANYEDYSIIERFEAGTAGSDASVSYADAEDISYVDGTRYIVIPEGITSIDSAAYFMSPYNNKSITTYVESGDGSSSAKMVMEASLSSSNGGKADEPMSVPGLFSGYYDDYEDGTEEDTLYEVEERGNDRVEKISMSTVTSLPDYAFDSCERLREVELGAACTDIGIAPFRGCTSLETVTATGNPKIFVENDIIYELKDDGTYRLVQCLPTRGADNDTYRYVDSTTDPKLANVSEISESAFVECDNLINVDLSDSISLKEIPEDCFKDCALLKGVQLPRSVNYIHEGAFAGCKYVTVKIPANEVYIHRDALEHGEDAVYIWSYSDSSAARYAADNDVNFQVLNDDEHLVVFMDSDYTELSRTYLKDGGSLEQALAAAGQDSPTKTGYKFTGWAHLPSTLDTLNITEDCTFIAQYTSTSSSSGSGTGTDNNNSGTNNNGTNDNSNNNQSTKLYTVTVVNGSGSGSYVEGATVIITANNPASGKKFKDWTVETNNATLASSRTMATTFTMPAGDVKITANYEDDTSSSSSSSSSSSGNKNSSTVSGNTSGTSSTNSTKVIITRPGISDTDLAAAKVNGSKDGFIVKISETAEATAAVEAALTNKYGSLDNIRYVAMDISLYDSTGTNKITDTTGYTIDITIPIPDELREYAGNNKTAAVVNSQLESLSPKFTTIDGVPCVTFRATHFSPYTIYVDTQNLSAGTLDSTPQTGDGIHPKWFLSIGLACLSVILFMKKDKKTPNIKMA